MVQGCGRFSHFGSQRFNLFKDLVINKRSFEIVIFSGRVLVMAEAQEDLLCMDRITYSVSSSVQLGEAVLFLSFQSDFEEAMMIFEMTSGFRVYFLKQAQICAEGCEGKNFTQILCK